MLDKNYKVRVTPEQSREIHYLILLEGGEVSYGLKPQLQDEFLVVENEYDSVVIYYTDQDIFPTIENQEIQADDLIALLTDLSKSAENPLQNIEITRKFKVGDKVYIPNIKNLCTIRNDGKVITSDGQYYCNLSDSHDLCFVLATPENYEMLCKLYPHIEFEKPPKELKGSDLARAMLDKGWKYVPCYVSNYGESEAQKPCIVRKFSSSGQFVSDFEFYNHAVPFDPKTGEHLTQAVLDE